MKIYNLLTLAISTILISACSTTQEVSSKEFNESDYDGVSVVSAGPEYKMLTKGYNYGFYKEGEGVILPAEYFLTDVRYDGSALFSLDEAFYARKDKKWGKIHMDGKVVIDFNYDYLIESSDTLFYQDGKEVGTLIDGKETSITSDYKHLMGSFSYDEKIVLLVSNNGIDIVYIDAKTGEVETIDFSQVSNKFPVVHVKGKFGVYNIGEQEYVGEPIYDLVKYTGGYTFFQGGKEVKSVGMMEIWKD